MSLLVFVLIFGISIIFPQCAIAGWLGPSDYDECILENMRGATNRQAVNAIKTSCRKKFPDNDDSKRRTMGLFGPSDFDECILEYLDGDEDRMAVNAIRSSCRQKFPTDRLSPQVERFMESSGSLLGATQAIEKFNNSDCRDLKPIVGVSTMNQVIQEIVEALPSQGRAKARKDLEELAVVMKDFDMYEQHGGMDQYIRKLRAQRGLKLTCDLIRERLVTVFNTTLRDWNTAKKEL